jgi:hypothetical protein
VAQHWALVPDNSPHLGSPRQNKTIAACASTQPCQIKPICHARCHSFQPQIPSASLRPYRESVATWFSFLGERTNSPSFRLRCKSGLWVARRWCKELLMLLILFPEGNRVCMLSSAERRCEECSSSASRRLLHESHFSQQRESLLIN